MEVKAEVFTVYIPLGNKVGFRLIADSFTSVMWKGYAVFGGSCL